MKIREVNEDKKQFISLLLLADEQENMVDRYLEKGTMYVLEDGDVKAECVVTDEYSVLQVGTGDSPLTIPFYEKCGFVRSNKIPNFFTDNYDHPIYEGGVQLIDIGIFAKTYITSRLLGSRRERKIGSLQRGERG